MPLPRKFMNFSSQNGVIWCILGVLFSTFMCPMDCSSAEGKKSKTLVKILGGRQHRTTPAGQILGVATPATLAALTPMGTRKTSLIWIFVKHRAYCKEFFGVHNFKSSCMM